MGKSITTVFLLLCIIWGKTPSLVLESKFDFQNPCNCRKVSLQPNGQCFSISQNHLKTHSVASYWHVKDAFLTMKQNRCRSNSRRYFELDSSWLNLCKSFSDLTKMIMFSWLLHAKYVLIFFYR